MVAQAWSREENDAIVADYFAMLDAELARASYSKADHNRALAARLGRSRSSIEFKHQNISAVLLALGEAWIPGYKPASNFQGSLVDAVERWIERNPGWLEQLPVQRTPLAAGHIPSPVADAPVLWIGSPPAPRDTAPGDEPGKFQGLVTRFDPAGRDSRNRALGRAGEELVLERERRELTNAGRKDLARRVRWVSQEDGDGAGYDIASFEPDGRARLLEVKTTNGWERTPFFVTRNELRIAGERHESWRLMRLWDFRRAPKAFELRPPLETYVDLSPTAYQADIR